VFEPSLKLEREGCVMSQQRLHLAFANAVLIQITRAKVSLKVSLGRARSPIADLRML
jgi:hypothetical protein